MTGQSKPEILLVNDDGFESPFLVHLATALSDVASVHVVAPASEQSGVSHSFLGFHGHELSEVPGDYPFEFHTLTGTPSDCTKFALTYLYRNLHIDCVFSGPNKGENSGVSSIYSGTVAGAREAALWGFPSLALSLCYDATETMEKELLRFAVEVVNKKLYEKIPAHTFWNVNFPDEHRSKFAGFKAAGQGVSMFTDHFDLKDGKFFLSGAKVPERFAVNSDDLLLSQGYATITPMTIDQTLHSGLVPVQQVVDKFFVR